ncbi:MAG: hypothetical protein ABFS19_06575 [Thermodesulfobacteriota bacterium]
MKVDKYFDSNSSSFNVSGYNTARQRLSLVFLCVFTIFPGGLLSGCGADSGFSSSALPANDHDAPPLIELGERYRMALSDKKQLNYMLEHQLSGQTHRWQNPKSGHRYTVVAQAVFPRGRRNQPCRALKITATTGSRNITGTETGCRNEHGIWQLR